MTNITKYPLIDGFETTLAQERDGATGLVYLNTVPEFTFPAGVTTYIVVDPGKTKMQVAEINAIDSGAKTVTVSDITLEKCASVNYTQQTHSVGSVVRISDNYVFWKALATAINTKLDSDGDWTRDSATDFAGLTAKSLTTAQRDALTATNGMIIYNTTTGVLDQYIGGAWTQFASGTTPNASETVAGKVEVATSAEFNAGTDTGGTGASLVAVPSQIKAKNDSQDSSISTNASNISSNTGNIGSNTSNITALQNQQGVAVLQTTRLTNAASSTESIAHGLSTTPAWCEVKAIARQTDNVSSFTEMYSFGSSDGTSNKATYTGTTDGGSTTNRTIGNDASNCIHIDYGDNGGLLSVTATVTFDGTNVNIVRTKGSVTGSEPAATTIYLTLLVHG